MRTILVGGIPLTRYLIDSKYALLWADPNYKPLYSVGDYVSIKSSPSNDAGAAKDNQLESKLEVFRSSLEAALRSVYKSIVVRVETLQVFLKDNKGVVFKLNVSIGTFSCPDCLIIVGSSFDVNYQYSVFKVKIGKVSGLKFLSNDLVLRMVRELKGLYDKSKSN